ncbi:TRAP transporter TatT component family protein [Reinekea marinisedimentorum]|uniref:TRAP transporter TatT component family protein n=1 Tax=Reinekea marinisedimentorum TaxID=230495 RepID=A0A4R3I6P1_9GAMM|nr:TRAP transporter TatT component family protein [Reinekea marinisedimentorum]TCS40750.1 TRAP transporter TatT component family protein [Reinekea marinisedimentorum]
MKFRILASLSIVFFAGCATTRLPSNLSNAIVNSDDLSTVQDGLPSYLLMVDALTLTYPNSESLHLTAASLNGAYGGVFVGPEDVERKKLLSKKALGHAQTAFCLHDDDACGLTAMDANQLAEALVEWQDAKDIPYLYSLGTAWASYIQSNSDDWLVVAQLGQAETVLKQVASLDPTYEKGTALLYLGVMNSILPPSLGGKPDVAKHYYEQALEVAQGQNLIIYVYYAANYARLVFDQELHDELLNEVLELDPYVDGYTLQNIYAQKQAVELLASSNDYF